MKNLKIKRIELESFRSFKDFQSIDFDESGLYKIQGINLSNNSKSGVGKSNLTLAIAYALGFSPFPTTELQCWFTDKTLQVTLILELDGNEYVIRRGKITSFTSPEGTISGSIKNVDTAIKQFLKIPLELFETLTYRPQGERSKFWSMTDSQKKEFLAHLLGLNELESQIEITTKQINELNKQIDQKELVVATLKNQLEEPKEPQLPDKEELDNKAKDLNLRISLVEDQLKDTIKELELFNSNIKKLKESITQPSTEVFSEKLSQLLKEEKDLNEFSQIRIEQLNKNESKVKNNIKLLQSQLKKIEEAQLSNSRYISELNILIQKIRSLEKNLCPTCDQKWIVEKQKIEEFNNNKNELELLVKQNDIIIKSRISTLEELDAEMSYLEEISKEKREISSDQSTIVFEIEQEKNKIINENILKSKNINKNIDLEVKKIELEAAPLVEKYNTLSSLKKTLTSEYNSVFNSQNVINFQINSLIKQFEKDKEKYLALKSDIDTKIKEVEQIKDEFKLKSDYLSLLKGFLGNVFEEVLNEIAEETNTILNEIPNVSNVTIQFQVEKLTQKDTVKQEIKPLIFKNGTAVGVRSGLSGGQFTSVELAIDLALNNVISRRMGIMPGWIILDESWDGLGVLEKESCLEVLKKFSKNKLYLIIDHTSEVEEAFDRTIEIVYKDEMSTIRN